MRTRTIETTWTLAAVAALTLATAGAARAQQAEAIDEVREVDRDVEVSVETVNRTVRVTGGDGAELRVQGTYYPDHEEFTLEGDAGSMTVTLEPTEDDWSFGDQDLDPGPLTIRLPRGASLQLEGVNGGVTVERVDGAVALESVNGGVRYTGGASRVEAETVNGPVEVTARRATTTRAGSVNGPVTLRVGGGRVEAEAVSGDVTIRADGPVGAVRAETVSGGITFRGRPAGEGELEFQTHSGDVELLLPDDLDARLEASVFSGDIESAFGGEVGEESRWTSQKSFRHTVGSGGPRISAEAFSGDVRFLKAGG